MSTSEFDQLAAEIGRDIVARAAPLELPLYRSISTAYLESPPDASRKAINKEEMLEFGTAEAVVYLPPSHSQFFPAPSSFWLRSLSPPSTINTW